VNHRAQITAEFKAIPRRRWRYKLTRLAIALGLIALLVWVALPKNWSVWIDLGIAVAAGYCISEDLTRGVIRFIIAAVRDMVNAIAGKNGPESR
jgi:hypothetical protein